MPHRSHSTQENPKNEPHPWLEEKVYTRLRLRTVDLVKRSVDALRKDQQRVSLATVAAKAKELDTQGKGISESAILDNPEARRTTNSIGAGVAHQESERSRWSWQRQRHQLQSSLTGMSNGCANGICA